MTRLLRPYVLGLGRTLHQLWAQAIRPQVDVSFRWYQEGGTSEWWIDSAAMSRSCVCLPCLSNVTSTLTLYYLLIVLVRWFQRRCWDIHCILCILTPWKTFSALISITNPMLAVYLSIFMEKVTRRATWPADVAWLRGITSFVHDVDLAIKYLMSQQYSSTSFTTLNSSHYTLLSIQWSVPLYLMRALRVCRGASPCLAVNFIQRL